MEREINGDMLQCLRAFTITARLLSQTRAAEYLGRTPSAISQQISKLEKNLAVSLFSRKGRTLTLTREGDLLLGYCIDLDFLFDKIFELNSAQAQAQIHLQIATTRSMELHLLAIIRSLQQEPAIHAVFSPAIYEMVLSQIRSGSVNAGIVLERDTPPDLEFRPFLPMRFFLCSLRGGKHPPPAQLTPKILASLPLCMGTPDLFSSYLCKRFEWDYGLKLNPAWPVCSIYTSYAYLLEDLSYLLTTNLNILDDERVESLDLSDIIPPTHLGLNMRQEAANDLNLLLFSERIVEMYKNNPPWFLRA